MGSLLPCQGAWLRISRTTGWCHALALPFTRWLSNFCQLLSMLELLLTLMDCRVVLLCHTQGSRSQRSVRFSNKFGTVC